MNISDSRHLGTAGILNGVRVLDFTAVISGPYCTRMLSDLGADVIKIEPPEGELLRHAPPYRENADGKSFSSLFAPLNAGKRSITLDLKKPESAKAIYKLTNHCDVVVENFAPGVMKRLGFDYSALRTHNEKLIMCSISGFGQSGPMAARPAYAPIVHAWSGFDLALLGAQQHLDKPLNMGPPVADTTASQQAFGAICAALFHRERTGVGQYIDISMYDALIGTLHKDFQQAQYPLDKERYYGPVKTLNGWIMIMVLSDRHFKGLMKVIDRPDLLDDPRFSSSGARIENYNDMIAHAAEYMAQHTTDELDKRFAAEGVPSSPYRELADSLVDEQLTQRHMITQVEDGAGEVTIANAGALFSETPAAVQPWVADLGAHNEEILRDELALSPEVLDALNVAH
ncbi:MAG: CoA transferase [Pseudomonadota bacterium]